MICLLCKKRTADQTGSHITSAFLLTSQIGKRGSEKAFTLSTDPNQDYSINQGDSGIKMDYILCRSCEKRLGFIEAIYSREIIQKIEGAQYVANFPCISSGQFTFIRCTRINYIAFSLFLYSIFWRASIVDMGIYRPFKLKPQIEEQLRFILDLFLPETTNHKIELSEKVWIQTLESASDLFIYFPFLILKAENLEDKEITFEYFDNVSSSPNHIMINEYIILPFFVNPIWDDDFFELKREVPYQDIINDKYQEPKIGILSNERYLKIVEKIRMLGVKQRIMEIDQQCVNELKSKGLPVTDTAILECRKLKVAAIKFDT